MIDESLFPRGSINIMPLKSRPQSSPKDASISSSTKVFTHNTVSTLGAVLGCPLKLFNPCYHAKEQRHQKIGAPRRLDPTQRSSTHPWPMVLYQGTIMTLGQFYTLVKSNLISARALAAPFTALTSY